MSRKPTAAERREVVADHLEQGGFIEEAVAHRTGGWTEVSLVGGAASGRLQVQCVINGVRRIAIDEAWPHDGLGVISHAANPAYAERWEVDEPWPGGRRL